MVFRLATNARDIGCRFISCKFNFFTRLITTMEDESYNTNDNEPIIPEHTRQAAKAVALLLFYSFLMFTLPFGAFFATKYILRDTFGIDGFQNTVYSVIASVIMIYLIIFAYVYQAYHDQEYDDHGNEINPSNLNLNLKED